MSKAIQRYLDKRTDFSTWPMEGAFTHPCKSIIVIPALGEYPGVLNTLNDLAACKDASETLVIIVVNNHDTDHAVSTDIQANQQTLSALQAWDQATLAIAWIDASSSGQEFPPKEGVGLARKLGMDWALKLLHYQGHTNAPIICLDADTRVDPDYLTALHAFFDAPGRWAGILPYAHPMEGTASEQAAILCYEFFLRYHALSLQWAGSPYGYHAIGSAMACTIEAYVAISGMNRRQAGEDFYFLQQLTKTGKVERVPGTTVHPSGRASHRVPFGTGRRVQRFLDAEQDEYRLYHPESYAILRQWLATAQKHIDRSGEALLANAHAIHPELATFLTTQQFAPAWGKIQAQSKNKDQLTRHFHRCFDGFRTLKLIHHLRDTTHPDAPMFEAIRTLLKRLDESPAVQTDNNLNQDLTAQTALLNQLRKL